MKSITKSQLSNEQIAALVNKHFNEATLNKAVELEGGMFNSAYLLQCSGENSPNQMVLKVGPSPGTPTLTYETEIMNTEVEVYSLLPRENIPAPMVLASDFSRDTIPSDCFFMQYIEGTPWKDISKKIPKENRSALMYELGRCNAAVHSIKGEHFGYPKADKHFRHDTWGEAFLTMVEDILKDGEKRSCRLPYESVRECLVKHRDLLNEITTPVLVDFDMWAGNVFLKQGEKKGYEISGIVDFERAFYGDAYADFTSAVMLFDDVNAEPEFCAGYSDVSGKTLAITTNDKIRMDMYRLYMALIMHVETYRYNTVYAVGIKKYTNSQIKTLLKKLN